MAALVRARSSHAAAWVAFRTGIGIKEELSTPRFVRADGPETYLLEALSDRAAERNLAVVDPDVETALRM
jgi:hypothetical protein